MNQFCRLPVWLRIAVAVAFLVAAIVTGIRGRPSAILAVASLALLVFGAWHLSRLRLFMLLLILLPLGIGVLLAGLDWHHPFLARYSAGLFSVIAVLLFMDAVRIEEWIEILHRPTLGRLQDVSPILIGTAVGIISLSAGVQEQRECRKMAGVYRWKAKSPVSVFLDSLSLPFYSAVESHEFIDEALHRWSSRRPSHEAASKAVADAKAEALLSGLTFGNSIFTARLADVYEFPNFRDLLQTLSTSTPLAAPWEKALAGLAQGSAALEINPRTGELTRRLLSAGLTVTVVEGIRAFRSGLRTLHRQHGSNLIIAANSSLGSLPGGFDCVFLYKNAFLEAINEMEPGVLLTRLFSLSKPGARVFFAYPALQAVAAEGTVFRGSVPEIGDIHFRYAGYERAGEMAKARLMYTVKQEHDCYCVRVSLNFRAPDLSSILLAAGESGFSHQTTPMPHTAGSFWTDEVFVELRKLY